MMKQLELSMKAKLLNLKDKVSKAREKIELTINPATGLILADLGIPQRKNEKETYKGPNREKAKPNEVDGDEEEFIEDEDFYD